jgi:integrase
MPTDLLTDNKVKSLKPILKPNPKPYKVSDGDGMYVLMHPNGSKYWRLKYRIAGKEKTYAIGVYPETTLAEARAERAKARALIKQGIDPVQAERETKRVDAVRSERSFEAVARDWIEKRSKRLSEGHITNVTLSLERDVFPHIGAKPIAEISTPDLLDVIKKVEERGALDVAGRIKQRCSAVFKHAIANHKATYNPAAQIESDAIATRKVTHRRYLKRDELPEFLRKLDAYDGYPLTKLALRLCLLTFVRSGELRGARWSEFNIERAEWRIPAERMKMGIEHIVPLSQQALAVLEEIKKHTWSTDLLFPSMNGGDKIMSENTLLYSMYRMGYHDRATVHGLRSTASSILNEIGWRGDVIERQLAHTEGNKVRRAYNHAEYLEERRKMMQAWADYIDQAAKE